MSDTKTLLVVRDGIAVDPHLFPSAAVVTADGASVLLDEASIAAPEGAIYVDQPGATIGWRLLGGTLVAPAPPPVQPASIADLTSYAAAKRFAVETGGITVSSAPIATDRESQAMIGNAYAYVQAANATSVSYKTGAGFVTLTADQIRAVALAVGAHVQACFKAEDDADAGINASPPTITTFAQVDAVFTSLTPAP